MSSAVARHFLLLLSVWLASDGSRLPFQTTDEAMTFLREAKMVTVEKRLGGVTAARKLVVEKDGVRVHAVFRSFERVYYNAEWDTGQVTSFLRDSYRNELAAFELSRLLGLDTVPPTVPWRMGRRAGSLQLWIENCQPGYNPKEKDRQPPDPERWQKERDKMRAFDALIENVDRNLGNMLIDPAGRVWWIDHTRSFGRQRKIGEPDLIRRCERGFYERLKATEPRLIAERLAPYAERLEIEALLERRLKLLALIEERIASEGEAAVLFTLEDHGSASR